MAAPAVIPVEISVVVPTFRRPTELLRTIETLCAQATDAPYEVIVVDNGCDAELAARVADAAPGTAAEVRYLPEPKLGVHNARHAGARAARASLLLYTDDDVDVDPGWIAAYARAFAEHPELAAAGGAVEPIWEIPPPAWLSAYVGDGPACGTFALLHLADEFKLLEEDTFYSVNMAIRREALVAAGGFHPEAHGDVWLGDGEAGLWYQLRAAGAQIGWVPDAVVRHRIPASRMTEDYIRLRYANEGASAVFTRYHPHAPSRARLAADALAWLRVAARRGVRNLLVRPVDETESLRRRLWRARAEAELRYTVRLAFSRHLRELVGTERWL